MLTALRRLYAGAVVAVVVWVVVTRRDDLAGLVTGTRPLLLAGCLLASLGQLALTSAVWHSGLRALGAEVPWRTVLAATAISGPARYLPGGVWYAVSRVAALRYDGVPDRPLAAVATLEMLLAPVVGLAVGLALLAVTGGTTADAPAGWLAAAVAVLLVLASPPVVNRALRWRAGTDPAPRFRWPALARLVGWLAVFWLWSGSVFALYVAAFPDAPDTAPLAVTGAYAVSWAVGWLAVFAPQGIGVFEATLAGLLGGGASLAVLLGGYRALIVVRDLGAAAAARALALRRRADRTG